MGRLSVILIIICVSLVFMTDRALAGSDVAFPAGWEKWIAVNTPLTEIGVLPGCDADISKLPPIYQETVATYCSIRPGGPGKVRVLVNPDVLEVYEKRNGRFPDGSSIVLHLEDMKVLFVLGHKGGEARYGVFTETGKDIAAPDGPLAMETCINCHTGYKAFCVKGQCGRLVKK